MFGFIFKKRLEAAINLADNAHEKTGDRYYVLPYGFDLMIFTKKDFMNYKRNGLIPRRNKMGNVINTCFYYTSNKFGNKPSPEFLQKKVEDGLKIMNEYYKYYLTSKFLNWCKKYKLTSKIVVKLS